MFNPVISIIIPIYNVEDYIINCFESIVKQTLAYDIEIIAVDDCGTDNSMIILEQYIKNNMHLSNRQIIIIKHPKNKGQAAARNTALKRAQGKYIFFLDSDDTLELNCLEHLLAIIQENHVDFIEGSDIHIHSDKDIPDAINQKQDTIISGLDVWKTYCTKWMPVPWNKLFKREFLINNKIFFKEGFFYEDLYWSTLVAIHNPTIRTTSIPTYRYTIRDNSTSHHISQKHIDSFIMLIQAYSELVQSQKHKNYNKYIISYYENFRALAIDTIYEKCNSAQCRYLFKNLSNQNINSLWELLTKQIISTTTFSKILPLYFGYYGHNIIIIKTKFIKFMKRVIFHKL